nr:gdsl esterase/lipase [Quercus suber]
MKTWELVFAALVVVLNLQLHVHGVPQVPCYFIFGDSLADNGNNNLPQTKAKVNYPPYGIDFPNGPTGRFTNGLTMFDMIAQLLGFDKLIPSFATANDSDILQGVNYASGAAGIRLEIGKHLVALIEYVLSKLLFENGIFGLHIDQIDGRHGCGSVTGADEAVTSGVIFFFAEVSAESCGFASVGDKTATFEVSNVEM